MTGRPLPGHPKRRKATIVNAAAAVASTAFLALAAWRHNGFLMTVAIGVLVTLLLVGTRETLVMSQLVDTLEPDES